MKGLIGTLGDRLQAVFPPNRVMLVLAGPITAGSLWLSAWLTANVPGVALPAGVIAGAMGIVGLIVVTLIYKWFEEWRMGERIDFGGDIEDAVDGLAVHSTHFFNALGTLHGVGDGIADLRARIEAGSVNEPEVATQLGAIHDVVADFVNEHMPAGPLAPFVDAAPQGQKPPVEPAPPASPPAAPAE